MADSATEHPERTWNDALAAVIKKEAEQSEVLYILHYKASVWAKRRNDCLQIPIILISTLTGFFSASSDLIPPIGIGALSVLVSALGVINTYFKYSQRAENHKLCSNMYQKIYKDLEIELSLPENQRQDPDKILPELRSKMARIAELSEPIPEKIIAEFKKHFSESKVSKPLIANGLDPVKIYREPTEFVVEQTPKPKISITVMKPSLEV